ncbi:MAG TPA: VOC family protein [Burkholderiales bacterium]|nr:VOC family protein [Burkholderiales bacterium]
MPELQLNHVNIPARDPDGLVRWYAETLGLRADGNKARGPGVLLVFKPGEPVRRAPELHLGFQVPGNAKLAEWAHKFGATISKGEEFNTFQVLDPEDNCLEIYCAKDS